MTSCNVTAIEIVEDFSSTARCDEGFLHLRRLRCRNQRADGSQSSVYRVDVVDRPRLDAVAVLVRRQSEVGEEYLTRTCLRPAAFFRGSGLPHNGSRLFCEEVVAGLLELEDVGEAGVKRRACAEVWEEAGFRVEPHEIERLGEPFFVAPGILSERIFLTSVDVTGKVQSTPESDGTPLEEGCSLYWHTADSLRAAIACGRIQDAKTELALGRFLATKRTV
jgi:ADP-ribose pyrophosphatase